MTVTIASLLTLCAIGAIGYLLIRRTRSNRETGTDEAKVTTMLDCDHCGNGALIYQGPAKPVDAVGLDEDEDPEPVESSKHKYHCPACGQYCWKHEQQLMKAVTDADKAKSPSWAAQRPSNRVVNRLRTNRRIQRKKAAQGA